MAKKPIRYVLEKSKRRISIWYDLAADHLKLRHEGIDAYKLPPIEKSLQIYQNKIEVTSNGDSRQTQFHAIYDNQRYVI